MRKLFTSIALSVLFLCAKSQTGTTVVISQVYGGGGNSAATYQNDFVELFNPTPNAVSLNNWSVQYASATGTTWQVAKLTNFSLQPGQYYLIKLAGGATGSALPAEDALGAINLSGTNGKVALSNDTFAITSCLPNAAIVDLVGYGTGNCFEGAAAAPTSGGNAFSVLRASNGCQDGNNNAADFAGAAVNPRNSTSPFSTCGAASPNIFPQPGVLAITTTVGNASAASSYNLSGTTLSPAAGNLTATAGAGLEISLSSGGPFGTSVTVPYSGGALAATPVFVRISAAASQGLFSGTVTNSGGGASDALVTVNGGIFQNYYNTKANLGLNDLGTWSSKLDGSGASPGTFNDVYQFFNIVNQTNANYSGIWDVSNAGNTSRIVVGDGVNPIKFTVLPDADSVTFNSRIDVMNNGTLEIKNNKKPFINTIATGSTIDFAETGVTVTDTVKIPALVYHHLRLTNGIKFLSTGTTTVKGNLTVDGVTSMNGSATSVSKINLFGNATFINGAAFDVAQGAEAARITIAFNGSGGTQSLNANGTELNLFQIRRDTTTSPCQINVSANSTMNLGGPTGGGLLLNQSGANTTVLNTGNSTINLFSGGFMSSSGSGKLSTSNGTINILKSLGTGDGGVLRFASGSTLSSLVVNLDPAITRDTLTIGDSVTVQTLTLTKGKVVVRSSSALSISQGGNIIGGSTTAYVDGKLRRTASSGLLTYPVGMNNKYAPVKVNFLGSVLNSYTTQYFFKPFTNFAIDPTTLATYPTYEVSRLEYWTIDQANQGTGAADLTFSFLDAGSDIHDVTPLRVAHYDGTDWNDIGGTLAGGSTTTNGSITATNVSVFSPFTLSAPTFGIIPVKLEYIRGRHTNNGNEINWKVTCLSSAISMQIERAADTRNFSTISTMNATQARCGLPFDFTDAQPLQGNNYYRLKMIDVDGKISYSPVVLIIGKTKGFQVVGMYPTVVTNQATLNLSSAVNTVIETTVTDMSGRKIQQQRFSIAAGSNLVNVDCSKFAAGSYHLTLITEEGNTNTIRFVKQ